MKRLSLYILPLLFMTQNILAETNYSIQISLNLEKGTVRGEQKMVFRNTGEYPLDSFVIRYEGKASVGEDRIVLQDDESQTLPLIPAQGKGLENTNMFLLRLPFSLAPNETITLHASFCGSILESGQWEGTPYHTLTGAWHPKIEEETISADCYTVSFDIPTGFTLLSTGREERIVSAHVKLMADHVREFFLAFIPENKVKVLEKTVEGIRVKSYMLAGEEKWPMFLLEKACDCIAVYKETFGFYPQPILNIIPGDKRFIGGNPVAPNIVAVHDLEKLGSEAELFGNWIIAHEIGHEYFYEYVLDSQFASWLSIGLGIYMDRQYVESRNLGEKWHWDHFSKNYIDAAEEGANTTVLLRPDEDEPEGLDRNNAVIHGKGYVIIRALEEILGRETFRNVVDQCLKRYAHRELRKEDFQRICEEAAQQDLDWFFEPWLQTNRVLAYQITATEKTTVSDATKITVRVERVEEMRMPMPVQATFKDGSTDTKWTDRRLDVNTLVFESNAELETVKLDPNGAFAMIPQRKMDASRLGKKIMSLLQTWRPNDMAQAADCYAEAIEKGLNNSDEWLFLGMALYGMKRYEEGIAAFDKMMEKGGDENSSSGALALVWKGQLYDLLGQREKAKECYQKALDSGKIPNMQHSQYGMTINRAYIQKLMEKPFERMELR